MTKEVAIRNHRKLWMWVHNETLKRKVPVQNEDYFDENNIPRVSACCYLCYFALNYKEKDPDKTSICNYCPVEWPDYDESSVRSCTNVLNTGLLNKLEYADKHEDYIKYAEIASEIASLPERDIV